MVTTTDEKPRYETNFVMGPDGFTESFDNHTVDVMCRMGLIKFVKETGSSEWNTKFYEATGRGLTKEQEIK